MGLCKKQADENIISIFQHMIQFKIDFSQILSLFHHFKIHLMKYSNVRLGIISRRNKEAKKVIIFLLTEC